MILLAGVALSASALIVLTIVTARRPAEPVPDLEGFLDRWSALHQGYEPRGNAWVRGWLAMTYRIAAPLARAGAAPDVLTGWTAVLALGVVAAADAGGRWPLLAAGLLVLSALGDSLDGAVAAIAGRATRWGSVLDSLVDRVTDGLYLVALWRLGGYPGAAVWAGAALVLLEYARARAGNAGMGEIGVVTVGERPTRVLLCSLALLGAGAAPARADLAAGAGLLAVAGVGAVGLVQLLPVIRRALAGSPPSP